MTQWIVVSFNEIASQELLLSGWVVLMVGELVGTWRMQVLKANWLGNVYIIPSTFTSSLILDLLVLLLLLIHSANIYWVSTTFQELYWVLELQKWMRQKKTHLCRADRLVFWGKMNITILCDQLQFWFTGAKSIGIYESIWEGDLIQSGNMVDTPWSQSVHIATSGTWLCSGKVSSFLPKPWSSSLVTIGSYTYLELESPYLENEDDYIRHKVLRGPSEIIHVNHIT